VQIPPVDVSTPTLMRCLPRDANASARLRKRDSFLVNKTAGLLATRKHLVKLPVMTA
jgi:hypothetical protein